ncbi:CSEP0326 putative effector protein [Blumeria hordei DH14]|uniref:CSEP0326 putative effector protein n=1 Tax=Blumeria graminis f. sp. hordei (strain DH14) TaxID=546991 RepID=N1JBQ2_BLUG1|nr:CSEP0326 putative effector protein [Blumeria hordei DH14]
MRRSIFTFLLTHLFAVIILVSRAEGAIREYHCDKQISVDIKYIKRSLKTIFKAHESVLSNCAANNNCENSGRYFGSSVKLYYGHDFNVGQIKQSFFKTSVPANFRNKITGSPYSAVASCKVGFECKFEGIVYKVPSQTSRVLYNDMKCSDITIHPLDLYYPLRLSRTSSKGF